MGIVSIRRLWWNKKVKLEEVLKTKQNLMDQISERIKTCSSQEAEIIDLKEEFERTRIPQNKRKVSKSEESYESYVVVEEELTNLKKENQYLKE